MIAVSSTEPVDDSLPNPHVIPEMMTRSAKSDVFRPWAADFRPRLPSSESSSSDSSVKPPKNQVTSSELNSDEERQQPSSKSLEKLQSLCFELSSDPGVGTKGETNKSDNVVVKSRPKKPRSVDPPSTPTLPPSMALPPPLVPVTTTAMAMPSGNTLASLPPDVAALHQLGLLSSNDVSRWLAKRHRPKKFICEHCQAAFSNNGQLKGHVRIHTGERPFHCAHEGCGKTFTRNEELTRHRRIHSGVRPYPCPCCGKHFGRKDHLKKHARTHQQLQQQQQQQQQQLQQQQAMLPGLGMPPGGIHPAALLAFGASAASAVQNGDDMMKKLLSHWAGVASHQPATATGSMTADPVRSSSSSPSTPGLPPGYHPAGVYQHGAVMPPVMMPFPPSLFPHQFYPGFASSVPPVAHQQPQSSL